MTIKPEVLAANSLLKELEAVVQSCEIGHSLAPGSAFNFIRAHHAEIAEAVKDARQYRNVRSALYQENIMIGEAELVFRVYGVCPSIEKFDAAIDAMHNSVRDE